MLFSSSDFDFQSLFQVTPGLFIVLSPDLKIVAVTDEYLRATMVRREEVVGRYIFDIFPDNSQDSAHLIAVRDSFLKVFETGVSDTLPLQKYDVQRPIEEGGGFEERFWCLQTFPYFDETGKIPYVIHRIEDITKQIFLEQKGIEQEKIALELHTRAEQMESERDQAEDALEDTQLRLEAALKAGQIGTWAWDVVKDRVFADESMALFFSVSKEIASGGSVENYIGAIHVDDQENTRKIIEESLAEKDFLELECRVVQPDNSFRWIVARGRVVRDENGKPTHLPGVVIDITDRKQSEEALRESEERFLLIASTTNDAIWDWDLNTNQVWWNEGVQTLFGYKPEEVNPESSWWYEHIHVDDRERVVAHIHNVIESGQETWSDEYCFMCADGGFRYVFDRGFAVHKNGKPVRMLGAMQDITARKKAEEEARKSQERLQLVLDASQLGLWYCDLPFDVLNWSDLTKEHFWLPMDAIVTYDLFYERIHEEDRESTRSAIDKSIEDRTHYDVEYRTVNPNTGDIKWIRAIGRGFYDEDDQPYRFDGITIDISDDKHIQSEREHLLWSEKAARAEAENANRLKDDFLATLSHELRTPLTSILGWSRMLAAGQLDADQSKRALETIERNAKAQSQLIEDILDVSRIISGKLRLVVRPIDLSVIIEAAVDSVRPAADAKEIRIQRMLDSGVGFISGDADRLQQIIWNLLSNAIKFTPKGGRVQIKLERVNSHIELIFADNGIGIDTESLPYIFERFRQSDSSTTRKHGGLGLGLAIVRHLVELHGGTIHASSNGLNQGSIFTIAFPLIPIRSKNNHLNEIEDRVHPTADENIELSCPPELNGLRVLVVDDEADTRELLISVFENCQAEIIGASSALEALEKIKTNNFDILVSDIGMPEHDGYELISKIRKLPVEQGGRIPAVALTAYARVEDRMRALSAGFQMHVPKPVEPAELLTIIASLADWNSKK